MIKFKRIKAMLLAGALAVTTCMTGMTALADGPTEGTHALSEIMLTKNLSYPTGVNLPTEGLTFAFTASPTDEAPEKWNETGVVYEETGHADLNIASVTVDGDSSSTESSGTTTSTESLDSNVISLAEKSSFAHGGVYLYEITETQGENEDVTYDTSTKYYLTVYVKAEDNQIDKVTLRNADGTKIDTLTFNNSYAPGNLTLKVDKSVTGAYASHEDVFNFSITLNASAGVAAGTEYANVTLSDGATTTEEHKVVVGTAWTFTMKHGSSISISGLPAGMTYTVTETDTNKYTESYVVTAGGKAGGSTTGLEATGTVTTKDPSIQEDVTDLNKVSFTNSRTSSTPTTGIIMNNLPFILLVVVAVAGAITYVVFRKRITR